MRIVLALIVVLALSAVSGAQQASKGRALAIEDYYRLKNVGDVSISPSGRWVAYTVTTRIEADNHNQIDTFVVPVDGLAGPRRIAHRGSGVASPRWTGDNELQYSLNSRVNSAVFVGGDASRERPEESNWRIAVDVPDAVAVAAPPATPGIWTADG